jgi:hypothetical protein
MNKQTFEPGTLLFRVKTGQPAIVIALKETPTVTYGTLDKKRVLYRIFEDGRYSWKHDMQVHAEYKLKSESEK